MFASPCSLRSTQCATLIALAAAAGISRFEPAPAKPSAPQAIGASQTVVVSTPIFRLRFYPAAMQALAPPVHILRGIYDFERGLTTGFASLDFTALAPAEMRPPVDPAAEAPVTFVAPTAPALSTRKHSHPYAVGPPTGGIEQPLRAAGTAVPGDSSARRSQVPRIARVFLSFSSARLMRLTVSGLKAIESDASPKFRPARRTGRSSPPDPRGRSARPGRRGFSRLA